MWVIPPEQDAEFVCQMEAVLDVYKCPYDKDYPVVCLDESPKQLVSEVRQSIKQSDGSTSVIFLASGYLFIARSLTIFAH